MRYFKGMRKKIRTKNKFVIDNFMFYIDIGTHFETILNSKLYSKYFLSSETTF